MKAITTRFKGWTETKPSRIVASDNSGNRLEKSISSLDNGNEQIASAMYGEVYHRAAAQALCLKMGWTGEFVSGVVKEGYVHVFVNSEVTA